MGSTLGSKGIVASVWDVLDRLSTVADALVCDADSPILQPTTWPIVACALNLPALRSLLLALSRGLCLSARSHAWLQSQIVFEGFPIEEADRMDDKTPARIQ